LHHRLWANFYVVSDGTSCSVAETAINSKPTAGNVIGDKYETQADAEKATA
jgi:hypothetical protein